MKRKHTINLFPITNMEEIDFSFKLISFDWQHLKLIEENFHQNVSKLAYKISSKIKGPCALYYLDGVPHFAIPATAKILDQKISIGPLQVQISSTSSEHRYNISLENVRDENISVIHQFLEFTIKRHLNNHPDLWNFGANQYFWKKPVNYKDDGNIDIFGGFRFKVVRSGKQFSVVLDVNYKYLGRDYLSDLVNKGNVHSVGKKYKGARCLYMNGDDWYTVVVDGFADNIDSQQYNGVSIYDYVLNKNKKERFKLNNLLNPSTISLLYKYPGRAMQPHTAAACLARLIYKTDHPDIKPLHNKSALSPQKRIRVIEKNIDRFFQNISLNGRTLTLQKKPISVDANFFPIPSLKFNNDQVLSLNPNEGSHRIQMQDFGNERKKMIVENGIINRGSFGPQYLIVPSYIEREKVKIFREYLEKELKKLAPNFSGFSKIVTYPARLKKSATFQVTEIEKALKDQNISDGFGLFVLPNYGRGGDSKLKTLHDCLKNKFYPQIKFQCASEFRISSFLRSFPDLEGGTKYDVENKKRSKFRSYLFNLSLELLLINRKWPYALVNDLNYDIYIGIDVHERYAGFTFFYKNGEQIFFDAKKVPKKTGFKRAEKIRATDIVDKLYMKLKNHIPIHCPDPNGIVIIRDGRSFGEEEKALEEVMDKLSNDGLIQRESFNYGVVDLHKQSTTPLRIASRTNGYIQFENPRSGSYYVLDESEGFIFSTGFPFSIPGSAKPINISVTSGSLKLELVMQDIYHQCMLAFSAPDRSNSLPITIKLIDNMIQPLANVVEESLEEDDEVVTTMTMV